MLHFPSKPKQWPDGELGKGERADRNREETETKYGFEDAQRTEGQKHRGTDFQGRQTNMSLSGATAALATDQLHTGGGMRQHLERVVCCFSGITANTRICYIKSPTFPLPPTPTHNTFHGFIGWFVEAPSFPHFFESGLAFKVIFLGKTGHGGIQTNCIIN